MKVVLVGVGNMGSAMVKAWLRAAAVDAANITLLDTDPAKLKDAPISSGPDSINNRIAAADIVVLAIKPQDLDSAAIHLSQIISSQSIIISILAGVSIDRLATSFVKNNKIIRAMPNIGARICQSMTAYVCSDFIQSVDSQNAEKLLMAMGPVARLKSESLMDAWCAVAGSGPGFIIALMENFVAAAIDHGFSSEIAEQMVKQTFFGTVSLVNESKLPLSEIREQVTSKGGTTAAGLEVLKSNQVSEIIKKTVLAATERGRELNRG